MPLDERGYLRLGWSVATFGFLGFILWAAFAPLDKGVASSGTVIVSGNRKTVQAFSSGVIEEIKVKEGDFVSKGQLLIKLRQQQLQAQQESVQDSYLSLLATRARLLAEKDNSAIITFSPVLMEKKNHPHIAEVLQLQHQLLYSRREALTGNINLLEQSYAALSAEITGLQNALTSKKKQLSILREQSATLKQLMAKGYHSRSGYLDIQRQFAEVESDLHQMQGSIRQRQKQQQEIKLQIVQQETDHRKELYTLLAENEQEIGEYRNKLRSADVDLQNSLIYAPVSGTVVGLTVFTLGGVVQAGENLLDIVPDTDRLMVEAQLAVNLVDKVQIGLPVELIFSAFNQNTTPKIPGEVTLISADSLEDKTSGTPYYRLEIAVTAKGKALLAAHSIKAGMPVEVFIKTGSRSLLSYLFRPVMDRAKTALSEE